MSRAFAAKLVPGGIAPADSARAFEIGPGNWRVVFEWKPSLHSRWTNNPHYRPTP